MINSTVKHERSALAVRARLLAALVLVALAAAGCGGGGHSSSPVHVDSAVPHVGAFVGGTHVTIHGTNFVVGGPNSVLFGGRAATNVVAVDASTITCDSPAGTPGSTVDVVVQNGRGSGRLNGGFQYLSPAPPTSDVNGDGIADLIVAAPSDSSGGAGAGAVFIFFGTQNNAGLFDRTADQADVKIVGHHPGDGFGACVCTGDLNGDHVDDLVVGANLVDGASNTEAGACYVFYGPLGANSNMIALAADVRLTGEATTSGDRFGAAALLADMDGDGRPDLVVGAPLHDTSSAIDAGCIYVFRGGPSFVSKGAEQADFTVDGMGQNEHLGARMTCGDLNGDGIADLAICSPSADVQGATLMQHAGCLYIVCGGSQMASMSADQADAVFSGEAAEDQFGTSAAMGDVNGDGIADLVVGAPFNDSTDADVGRVYVFYGTHTMGDRPADQADATISGLPTHNSFGTTIRLADVNGDAIEDLLIGAPHADYLNDGNGRAYVFWGGSSLGHQVAIDAAATFNGEGFEGEQFGASIALFDLNGDGFADVGCASSFHNQGAGRVYMWLGGNGTLVGQHQAATADVHFNGLQPGSLFGSMISDGQ